MCPPLWTHLPPPEQPVSRSGQAGGDTYYLYYLFIFTIIHSLHSIVGPLPEEKNQARFISTLIA